MEMESPPAKIEPSPRTRGAVQALLDAIEGAVLVLDDEGRVQDANCTARSLWLFPPSSPNGSQGPQLPKTIGDPLGEIAQAVLTSQAPVQRELDLPTEHGQRRLVVSGQPLGATGQAVLVCRQAAC